MKAGAKGAAKAAPAPRKGPATERHVFESADGRILGTEVVTATGRHVATRAFRTKREAGEWRAELDAKRDVRGARRRLAGQQGRRTR